MPLFTYQLDKLILELIKKKYFSEKNWELIIFELRTIENYGFSNSKVVLFIKFRLAFIYTDLFKILYKDI